MRRELGLALTGAGVYFALADGGFSLEEPPEDEDYYATPDEETPDEPPPREDNVDPIIQANLIDEYTPQGPYYFVRAYIAEHRWSSRNVGDGQVRNYLTYLNIRWQTGTDGFHTEPPVQGAPVRSHYFEIPVDVQDSLSGYFPVIRGLPSSYVRDCRIYMVAPGGSSTSQTVQIGYGSQARDYRYTRDDLKFSRVSEKSFYVRHDGLIAFERLQVTDFMDGVTGLMVVLSGSAASLEGSSLSFEVWDRDPAK